MGVSIDRLRFACCSRRVWDTYFSDRIALVTGGASGVGRATVLALAGAGAITVIADVDEHGGRQVLQEAEQAGGVVRFVRTDVAREADVQALVEGLTAEFGRLDCAVNNAAIEDETAPLAECTEAAFDRITGVNLKGVFLCMKHEIRAMEAVGSGSIVNLASVSAFRAQTAQPAYTASKHGVLGLTRAAALDYAPRGIRINAVCPGAIRTPMLEAAMERRGRDADEVAQRLTAAHRLGQPEEVARAVLWLLSAEASFTYGHPLVVDGGYLAR